MSTPGAPRIAGLIALLHGQETKVRFIAAGVLNTIFGLGIYPLLMWLLASHGLHYLVILIFAQGLSIIFSFMTNKFLVFRTRGKYISEFSRFITFHLVNLAANLLLLPVLVELVKMSPVWAQFFFAFAIIVSSYFWHKRITFQPRSLHP